MKVGIITIVDGLNYGNRFFNFNILSHVNYFEKRFDDALFNLQLKIFAL